MAEISRASLFGKLNTLAYRCIEAGTAHCKSRGNPYVELQHWIVAILQAEDSDLARICTHFGVDSKRLAADLTDALARLPAGAKTIIDFGDNVPHAIERSWTYSTLLFKSPCIRTGHLLVGMLRTGSLASGLKALSGEFARVDADKLTDDFDRIVGTSAENGLGAHDGSRLVDGSRTAGRDIFLSYRRAESIHIAGRIFDRLRGAIGVDRVFKDVNSIPLGHNFMDEIRAEISTARLMLVLIGPTWLNLADETGQRKIDDPTDTVRIELQWALDHRVPIIPVLFDGATMPAPAGMPESLRAFASTQALQIRPDPGFDSDMEALIVGCRSYLAPRAAASAPASDHRADPS